MTNVLKGMCTHGFSTDFIGVCSLLKRGDEYVVCKWTVKSVCGFGCCTRKLNMQNGGQIYLLVHSVFYVATLLLSYFY